MEDRVCKNHYIYSLSKSAFSELESEINNCSVYLMSAFISCFGYYYCLSWVSEYILYFEINYYN